LAAIRLCSTTSWMRSMSGGALRKLCSSTFTTWAVSKSASASPNSPLACPARAMAERIRVASNAAR